MRTIFVLTILVVACASQQVRNKEEHVKDMIEEPPVVVTEPNSSVEKPKKPKCNLEYLACVKKGGGTRKAHMRCGKEFIKCKKRCYKKCKYLFNECEKFHRPPLCKRVYKRCAGKCPHLSKCAKKCKISFIKCKKGKGKDLKTCLKTFITCVKACKPKHSTYSNYYESVRI